MNNLNPLIKEDFLKVFQESNLYIKLRLDYDILISDWYFDDGLTNLKWNPSPREYFGGLPRKTLFSIVPFYYFQFLNMDAPTIYDLGCGSNLFKQYYPNITGIDNDINNFFYNADYYGEFVDPGRINSAQFKPQLVETIIAINSMHYCSLTNVQNRVQSVSALLLKGGKALITFNMERMFANTDRSSMLNILESSGIVSSMFDSSNREHLNAVENYVRQLFDLKATEYTILVFDLNLSHAADSVNGNLRVVIERL